MGLRCCDCSYVKDLDKFLEDDTAYKISIANLCIITNGNIIVASEGERKKNKCARKCAHVFGCTCGGLYMFLQIRCLICCGNTTARVLSSRTHDLISDKQRRPQHQSPLLLSLSWPLFSTDFHYLLLTEGTCDCIMWAPSLIKSLLASLLPHIRSACLFSLI